MIPLDPERIADLERFFWPYTATLTALQSAEHLAEWNQRLVSSDCGDAKKTAKLASLECKQCVCMPIKAAASAQGVDEHTVKEAS